MKKILIVEDDREIAELERDYLEASDFEVAIEGDGRKGVEAALAGGFDLVILDLMLPGIDGFNVCRRLREELDIPVIIVSARQTDIDKIRGFGLGADDYMTKPFSPSELVARVKALRAADQEGAAVRRASLVRQAGTRGQVAPRLQGRRGDPPDEPRVRAPALPHGEPRARLQPLDAVRAHLGPRCDGRQRDGRGAHQPHPREDRDRPRASRLHRDGARRWLPLPPRLTQPIEVQNIIWKEDICIEYLSDGWRRLHRLPSCEKTAGRGRAGDGARQLQHGVA